LDDLSKLIYNQPEINVDESSEYNELLNEIDILKSEKEGIQLNIEEKIEKKQKELKKYYSDMIVGYNTTIKNLQEENDRIKNNSSQKRGKEKINENINIQDKSEELDLDSLCKIRGYNNVDNE
ncbi:hypothetical protein CU098_008474, partial [Rhizopus stolonifer]